MSERLHILFLSAWFPYPPVNGSKLRVYHLLRQLAARHEVVLLSFVDARTDAPDDVAVRSLCRVVEVWPRPSFEPGAWSARLAYFHRWPRSVVETFCAALAERVSQ